MTDFDWAPIRDSATERFGEPPGAKLETEVIHHFEQNPRRVIELIDRIVAERIAGNSIRSCWALLNHRLNTTPPPASVSTSDTHEREGRIGRAEAWIRNAGHYLPEPELLRALFSEPEYTPTLEQLQHIELETRERPGRHLYASLLAAQIRETETNGPQAIPDTEGTLHAYDSPALRTRMITLYREHRPRGIAAQEEHERRALERVELRAKLVAAKTAHTPPTEPGIRPVYDDDPNWHHAPEPELEHA